MDCRGTNTMFSKNDSGKLPEYENFRTAFLANTNGTQSISITASYNRPISHPASLDVTALISRSNQRLIRG